jgi:hypothetical protein
VKKKTSMPPVTSSRGGAIIRVYLNREREDQVAAVKEAVKPPSMAQRIKELHAEGLRNTEIAKTLGIRPQNVFRVLHRGDRQVKRVKVDWSPERLANAKVGACDDLCQVASSALCECPCEGMNHGVLLTEGRD